MAGSEHSKRKSQSVTTISQQNMEEVTEHWLLLEKVFASLREKAHKLYERRGNTDKPVSENELNSLLSALAAFNRQLQQFYHGQLAYYLQLIVNEKETNANSGMQMVFHNLLAAHLTPLDVKPDEQRGKDGFVRDQDNVKNFSIFDFEEALDSIYQQIKTIFDKLSKENSHCELHKSFADYYHVHHLAQQQRQSTDDKFVLCWHVDKQQWVKFIPNKSGRISIYTLSNDSPASTQQIFKRVKDKATRAQLIGAGAVYRYAPDSSAEFSLSLYKNAEANYELIQHGCLTGLVRTYDFGKQCWQGSQIQPRSEDKQQASITAWQVKEQCRVKFSISKSGQLKISKRSKEGWVDITSAEKEQYMNAVYKSSPVSNDDFRIVFTKTQEHFETCLEKQYENLQEIREIKSTAIEREPIELGNTVAWRKGDEKLVKFIVSERGDDATTTKAKQYAGLKIQVQKGNKWRAVEVQDYPKYVGDGVLYHSPNSQVYFNMLYSSQSVMEAAVVQCVAANLRDTTRYLGHQINIEKAKLAHSTLSLSGLKAFAELFVSGDTTSMRKLARSTSQLVLKKATEKARALPSASQTAGKLRRAMSLRDATATTSGEPSSPQNSQEGRLSGLRKRAATIQHDGSAQLAAAVAAAKAGSREKIASSKRAFLRKTTSERDTRASENSRSYSMIHASTSHATAANSPVMSSAQIADALRQLEQPSDQASRVRPDENEDTGITQAVVNSAQQEPSTVQSELPQEELPRDPSPPIVNANTLDEGFTPSEDRVSEVDDAGSVGGDVATSGSDDDDTRQDFAADKPNTDETAYSGTESEYDQEGVGDAGSDEGAAMDTQLQQNSMLIELTGRVIPLNISALVPENVQRDFEVSREHVLTMQGRFKAYDADDLNAVVESKLNNFQMLYLREGKSQSAKLSALAALLASLKQDVAQINELKNFDYLDFYNNVELLTKKYHALVHWCKVLVATETEFTALQKVIFTPAGELLIRQENLNKLIEYATAVTGIKQQFTTLYNGMTEFFNAVRELPERQLPQFVHTTWQSERYQESWGFEFSPGQYTIESQSGQFYIRTVDDSDAIILSSDSELDKDTLSLLIHDIYKNYRLASERKIEIKQAESSLIESLVYGLKKLGVPSSAIVISAPDCNLTAKQLYANVKRAEHYRAAPSNTATLLPELEAIEHADTEIRAQRKRYEATVEQLVTSGFLKRPTNDERLARRQLSTFRLPKGMVIAAQNDDQQAIRMSCGVEAARQGDKKISTTATYRNGGRAY